MVKATIKYGGDCSYLVDLVRGTLVFESLLDMYDGLHFLVTHELFKGGAHFVAEFEDRYMQPLTGGYSDIQMILSISGHLCELQVSTKDMLEAKSNGGGHAIYNQTRFIHEYILYSAIINDEWGLRRILRTGLCDDSDLVKDKNHFRALHFAAVHSNESMAAALLEAGASPFIVSLDGQLAATLAAVRRDWAHTGVLLDSMEARVAKHPDVLSQRGVRTALHLLFSSLLEAPTDVPTAPATLNTSGPTPGILAACARLVLKVDKVDSAAGMGTVWHAFARQDLSAATNAVAAVQDGEAAGPFQELRETMDVLDR